MNNNNGCNSNYNDESSSYGEFLFFSSFKDIGSFLSTFDYRYCMYRVDIKNDIQYLDVKYSCLTENSGLNYVLLLIKRNTVKLLLKEQLDAVNYTDLKSYVNSNSVEHTVKYEILLDYENSPTHFTNSKMFSKFICDSYSNKTNLGITDNNVAMINDYIIDLSVKKLTRLDEYNGSKNSELKNIICRITLSHYTNE